MLIIIDRKSTFLLSGTGDLIEPDDGIIGIGSGGGVRAGGGQGAGAPQRRSTRAAIAEQSMKIASEICVYTNGNLTDRRTVSVQSVT